MRGDPIITIGDRCTLGKGIGIVGHERIEIGDDIWTGHYVYVTDQNHGYEDLDLPIGTQMWKNEPVSIGDGSWLGHGAIVLPGSRIGRHVVVAAGAVVAGLDVPDNSVVAGVPARVVRTLRRGGGLASRPPRLTTNRYEDLFGFGASAGTGSVFGSERRPGSSSRRVDRDRVRPGRTACIGVGRPLARAGSAGRRPSSRYMPGPTVPVSSGPVAFGSQ